MFSTRDFSYDSYFKLLEMIQRDHRIVRFEDLLSENNPKKNELNLYK